MGYRTLYQVEQFTGTQVPQIVESFMFAMLSNSIKFRDIFMKVQMEYSPVSQTAQPQQNMTYVTLVEQSARFLKSIIYFDNLYLNTTLVKAFMSNMAQVKN